MLAWRGAAPRHPPRAIVLTIARVYHTDERAVETADIIIPVERYALVYDVPVR